MPTSVGFTGQRADSVTGLDYYNARYYDPVVGIFTSVDTVQGNAQGMDPYGYVRCNPETRTDPTGHWSWGDTFAAVGCVLAVAAIVTVVAVAAPALVATGAAVLTGDTLLGEGGTLGALGFTAL